MGRIEDKDKDKGQVKVGHNNVNGQSSTLAAQPYTTLCIRVRAIHSFADMRVSHPRG